MEKIIWALDVFETKNETQPNTIRFLKTIESLTHISIQPVYVLSPDWVDDTPDTSPIVGPARPGPAVVRNYEAAATRLIESIVKKSGLKKMTPPKVISQPKASLTESAKALIRYAKSQSADLIVVGSHAREGVPRLFLGSFAETLLLHSDVPVMVVKVGKKPPARLNKIIFPTNGSDTGFAAFKRLLPIAKDWKAKITILHVVPNPVEPVVQAGVYMMGGGWVSLPKVMDDRNKKTIKRLNVWKAAATGAGVKCEIIIDDQGRSVLSSILERSAKDAQMIALEGQSSALTSTLVGSITRQVVRHADVPVWVYHREPGKRRAASARSRQAGA